MLAVLGGWAVWDTPVDAIPDLSENQVIVFTEWKGHGPPRDRGPGDLSADTWPAWHEGGPCRSIVERRRLLDDQRHLRGPDSDRPGAATGCGTSGPVPGAVARRSNTRAGAGLSRDRPDLLVHVRRRRSRPGPARAIQDWYVRPQLGSVPGVAEVSSVGGFPIEYEVAPDPDRLRLFGVTLEDVLEAVASSNAATGGHVVNKGNAEYVVRGVGWLGASTRPGDDSFDPRRAIRDLENVVLPADGGGTVRLAEVATVAMVPGFRRGVLEKDGNEVVGGVVLMAHGENPLEVTRRIKAKIRELQAGLPRGVRIVPFYDRTPLIEGAIGTVSGYGARGDGLGLVLRAGDLAARADLARHRRAPCRLPHSRRS